MSSNQYDAQASTNYKEAFSLFDKRGNGRVTLDNLGDLLRACGQNPTMSEIRDLEKSVGGDCESWAPPPATFVYKEAVARNATIPLHAGGPRPRTSRHENPCDEGTTRLIYA